MNAPRLVWLLALCVQWAASPAMGAARVLPQYSPHDSVGVGSCANSLCHGAVETWPASSILQNEYVTWSRRDRHAQAYAVLLDDRSKDIARRLGLKEPAHRAKLCLDCHAHNVPQARRARGFVLSDGVTCEACHGPAGGWLQSHVEPQATHADNLARGLYPLKDYESRARLCLSCHLGTSEKFVSHDLMAAGHPRMSFELDTFTQLEPPHFRRKSTDAGQELWDGVKIWAIGQALAAQRLLTLLEDPVRGRRGFFPELVLFDCHACHHPMSDQRNAGARLGVGPGVVRLNDSNLLMVRQIARCVDPAGQAGFAREVHELYEAIATGDNALAQARVVQAALARLLPRISAHRFSRPDLDRILTGLIDEGLAGQYEDYQGAEQAAMALQAVADFMSRRGMLRSAAVGPSLQRLVALLADDEHYSPAEFEQTLRALKARIEEGRNQ